MSKKKTSKKVSTNKGTSKKKKTFRIGKKDKGESKKFTEEDVQAAVDRAVNQVLASQNADKQPGDAASPEPTATPASTEAVAMTPTATAGAVPPSSPSNPTPAIPTPKPVEEKKVSFVPNKSFRSRYAGTWYYCTKGEKKTVPESVRNHFVEVGLVQSLV